MSVVYVYPKCPAGNSEGHWLSALHRFASVFSKPSILTLELTFFLLSLFFFPFFFLFCCLICFFSRFFLCFSKTFATRFLAAKPRTTLCIFTAGAMNGCSAGSSLVLLTVGDLNFPALTMRMAFVTLRAFHEHGSLMVRASSDNLSTAWVMYTVSFGEPCKPLGSSSFPRLVGPRSSLGEHPYLERYFRMVNG